MRKILAGLSFALGAIALVAGLRAQTPPASGTGLIAGRVVDGLSDRPVGGSLVTLIGQRGGTVTVVLSDGQGRFVFSNLSKNNYSILTSKAGYSDGRYGQRRPAGPEWDLVLADAERVGDVKVPIWKHASITGTITDELGEPLVDLPVRVLSRTVVAGKRKLTPGVTVKTDDRGVYRIGGLTPGEYVVAVPSTQSTAPESVVDLYRQSRQAPANIPSDQLAAIRALTTGGANGGLTLGGSSGAVRVGDLAFQSTAASARAAMSSTLAADGRIFVYPALYYSAAANAGQALAIPLQSGEERSGINLQLRLSPTARVSGIVTGPDGPLMVNLALIPSGDDLLTDTGFEAATTVSDAAGHFTFLGVPVGQYVLRVLKRGPGPSRGGVAPTVPSAPTLWATQLISVGPAGIPDLVVPLRTGFRVTGTVLFDDTTKRPLPDVVSRIMAIFESVDGRPPVPGSVSRDQFDGAGQFSSYELVPGRYYLRVSNAPVGWALKSAMLDGRDISNVPLNIDRPLTGVTITFTNRPAEVSGRVQTATGAMDATATVLIFPADTASWTDYGVNPPKLRAIRADRNGAFQFFGMPAGDYLIAAIPDESAADALDPRVLQTLARLATSMTLADGDKRTIVLKTVAVPR